MGFFFPPIKWFLQHLRIIIVDMLLCVLSSLQHVVLTLTFFFFMVFRIGIEDGKVSIWESHHIKSCLLICCKSRILVILSIFRLPNMYYVGLESFPFALT